MSLNIELAERVLEQVTEHPQTHDQGTYGYQTTDCGTTHCVAGWAVVLTPGVELNWTGAVLHSVRLAGNACGWITPFDAARELLGLNQVQAENLFLGVVRPGGEDGYYPGGGTEAGAVAYLRELIAAARTAVTS